MSKHFIRNLILLVVVIALAAVIYFKPQQEEPQALPPLTDLAPNDIRRLVITRPDEAPIVLIREQDRWWLKEPLEVAANQFRVRQILAIASARSHGRYPLAAADRRQYGLAKPAVSLELDGLALHVGHQEVIDRRRYVEVSGELHLIDDMLYRVDIDATELVDRALLPREAHIEALTLPTLQLRRTEAGGWAVEPAHDRLSADAPQKLVDAWKHAQAIDVRERSPGATSAGLISIDIDGQPPLRFELLVRNDATSLARPDLGLEYSLSNSTTQALLKLPEPEPAEGLPTPQTTAPRTSG